MFHLSSLLNLTKQGRYTKSSKIIARVTTSPLVVSLWFMKYVWKKKLSVKMRSFLGNINMMNYTMILKMRNDFYTKVFMSIGLKGLIVIPYSGNYRSNI